MIPQDLAPAILEGDVVDVLRAFPGDSNPLHRHLPSVLLGAARLRSPARSQVGRSSQVVSTDWEPTRPPRHRVAQRNRRSSPEVARIRRSVYEAPPGAGRACRKCGGWAEGSSAWSQLPNSLWSIWPGSSTKSVWVLRPRTGRSSLNLGDAYATHPCRAHRREAMEGFDPRKNRDPTLGPSRRVGWTSGPPVSSRRTSWGFPGESPSTSSAGVGGSGPTASGRSRIPCRRRFGIDRPGPTTPSSS